MLRPGGRLGVLEITTPRGLLAPFYRLWFDRIIPLARRLLPGGAATRTCPPASGAFPIPSPSPRCSTGSDFRDVRFRLFAGGIVALHVGVAG